MKPDESFKELESRIRLIDEEYPDMVEYKETIKLATKALKKQIPQKILFEDVGYNFHYNANLYSCICPSCGAHIIDFSDNDVDGECDSGDPEEMFHSSMVHHAYEGRNNYCDRCGQKLDWGDD